MKQALYLTRSHTENIKSIQKMMEGLIEGVQDSFSAIWNSLSNLIGRNGKLLKIMAMVGFKACSQSRTIVVCHKK